MGSLVKPLDNLKIVGIHTGPDTHLDHLGVLCAVLQIPLIVTEETSFEKARKFYPNVDVHLVSLLNLSLEFMATHFDVIIESNHFWSMELIPVFKELFNKKMRIIYCPHGHSDKRTQKGQVVPKDISLIYGIDMKEQIGKSVRGTVETGNFRYEYYLENKSFYDALLPHKSRKTLLYAPTWPDKENPSNFFEICGKLIEELAGDFDLKIKLHPLLQDYFPAETFSILKRYEETSGVEFIENFPPIYPLLEMCDAYLGDFSSIGYDFLSFNKPMFFTADNRSLLRSCGYHLDLKMALNSQIQDNWDQSSLGEDRKKLYNHVFGKKKTAEEISRQIKDALN
jgi:hypothetical protein